MTTDRQKRAVYLCERFGCEFEGDINSFNDVNKFLSENLDAVKSEILGDYWSVNNY